jgi:DNA-directed RNA polymerase subunit H
MHVLQPKHTKLKPDEVEKILSELNISLVQLPKIIVGDPGLPDNCEVSDVIKIERIADGKKTFYYRVVAV